MSKDSMKSLITDGIPRWALVVLAFVGVFALRDLHEQIKEDHKTLLQHSQAIARLERIAEDQSKLMAQLSVLIEDKRKKYEN